MDSCNYANFIHPPRFWDTLRAGGGGGPEINSPCNTLLPILQVPVNGFRPSFQLPKSGTNYCVYTNYISTPSINEEREYIQNELRSKLISGKSYCVKLYISLVNESKFAITEFGAYLDNGSISTPRYGTSTLTPQIKSPVGVFLNDTVNWTEIKGIYIANGSEKYLTLGNFKTNATTSLVTMAAPPPPFSIQRNVADYYVDDVSIIELDLKAFAGRDTVLCSGDSVFIGRPLETGLECVWFNNSTQIATGGGLYVKPVTSQNYIVDQDVCGIITKDTVFVQVKPKFAGAPQIQSSSLVLCPNDTANLIVINIPTTGTSYNWQSNLSLNSYTNISTQAKMSNTVISAGFYDISVSITNNGSGSFCPFNNRDTLKIEVSDTCFKELIVPNIFTPNSDKVNDVWRFKMPVGITLNSVYVYNRWGALIYSMNEDLLKGDSKINTINWDGHTTSGEVCGDGVYFYVIKYKNKENEIKIIYGNVSLIR
ncbi:MAG: gliding motility-associated C-terminal domain-containing protein [Bacteroidetes bacterium]|nr:gliding motility-associated C-terminal domain-containing protein [Bacteroidota bacterium]